MSKIKISVVICTYNRAEFLSSAIKSVLDQEFPITDYEIIVVDNNSTDTTRNVVEKFSLQYSHVHYVFEKNVGLSYARNRGWQEAYGEYVAYLDDDALAQPGWLKYADQIISTVHPAVFGGPILPYYLTPKPFWFKDEYATHIKSAVAIPLKKEYISGGNSFNDKHILQKLDGFRTDFGMSGKKIGYGEETELQMRLRKDFPVEIIYYHPNIVIRHLVPNHKMQFRWIFKSRFENGKAFEQLNHDPKRKTSALRAFLNFMRAIVKLTTAYLGIVCRDKKRYLYKQNYVYEVVAPLFFSLGSSIASFQKAIEEKYL